MIEPPVLRDDPKYKDDEEAYDDDLEEMQEKTDALKPKDFPYTFYLMDAAQEKAFDDPIFATYRGPVYWNDCGRYYHIRNITINVTFTLTTRDFTVTPKGAKCLPHDNQGLYSGPQPAQGELPA